MKRCLLLLACVLLFPLSSWAFPDEEKASITTPDNIPANAMAMDGDQFLYLSFLNEIFRIDTDTFAMAVDQVPDLNQLDQDSDDNTNDTGDDFDGNIGGIAIQGRRLFATQDDGDLIMVDLDDVTADPTVTLLLEGAKLGMIVADPEGTVADNILYIRDETNNVLQVVNSTTQKITASIPFIDQNATPVTPVAIAIAAIDGAPDKIYVTSDRGFIYSIDENATASSAPITVQPDGSFVNKELPAIASTPDGDFVLVVNGTDNLVHVFRTSDNTQIDTENNSSGVNPIDLDPNVSLRQALITLVSNPLVGTTEDTYAYISGNLGISVIDLNIAAGSVFNNPDVIDFNDEGALDDTNDPITISPIPLIMTASSADDGYIYSSKNDGNIAVITEKPFIDITGDSLPDDSLSVGESFTLTFRSDETGPFRVVVGGDSSGNGNEVAAGMVATADTDIVTPEISQSSNFNEGMNRVFIFVTDDDGNIGRDAVDINVDTPPPPVEIVRTNFGNKKIFVTFKRLNVDDINHYNVYVETDALAVATSTTIKANPSQPSSGDEVTASVEGLENGVRVFIGVEAVDNGTLVGPRTTTFPDGTPVTATPEETVGLTGITGETGCNLVPTRSGSIMGILMMVVGLFFLVGARLIGTGRNKLRPYIVIAIILCFPSPSFAAEETPQWWSLEFKAGAWLPLDSTTKDFLGSAAPTGMIEFAFLYRSKLGAELGVGFATLDGTGVSLTSGTQSGDSFNFSIIPIYNSFVFRADFKEEQLLVPFVKVGPDYLVFRENIQGNVTSGVKYGLHTAAGLQILLDRIDSLSTEMEEAGINDVYFTMEGRYAWIDDFGGNGIDLSNITLTGGLLFEF